MPVPPAPLGSSRSVGAPTARCLVRRTIRAVSTYTPGIVKIFRRAEANKLSGALERKFTRTSEQDRRTSRAASGSPRVVGRFCAPRGVVFFPAARRAACARSIFKRNSIFANRAAQTRSTEQHSMDQLVTALAGGNNLPEGRRGEATTQPCNWTLESQAQRSPNLSVLCCTIVCRREPTLAYPPAIAPAVAAAPPVIR
jgi:hypothetical protein